MNMLQYLMFQFKSMRGFFSFEKMKNLLDSIIINVQEKTFR